MDINNINRFVSQYAGNLPLYGGALPVQNEAAFGAMPVKPPVQPIQAPEPEYIETEKEFVGPVDDKAFRTRRDEYNKIKAQIGLDDDGRVIAGEWAGKQYYGPEAKTWINNHGTWDNVKKNQKLLDELDIVARNEARKYSGLELLPMPAEKTDMAFPQTQEEQDAFFRHIAMTGTFPNGQKAPSEMVTMAGARAFPDVSKRAMDRETFEQKKTQREQAENQALQNTIRYAEPMLGSIRNAKKILEDKGNLAAGVWANKLLPSWNQSYQDLKANLDAIGGSLLADSVKALRETSPNGTLGLRLTEKEILKEIQRMGPQAMEASPEQLLETLNRLEQMTTDSLNYAKTRLNGGKEKEQSKTQEQPKQPAAAPAAPKRFKFTANGDLIGG